MDEQQMRAYAMEASSKYEGDLADEARRRGTKVHTLEESKLKVKGVYRKPLSNEWQLYFNQQSVMFNENWQVSYVPKPDATDEEHIEEIRNILHARRELRDR